MADKLQLKVVLEAVERITKPLKGINRESRATQAAIADLRKQLKGLSGDQAKNEADAAALNARLAHQAEQYKRIKEQARQVRAAQAQLAETQRKAGRMAATGVAMGAAGAAMAVPVVKTVRDFAAIETAMLGVARQVEGARSENGQLTKTYYDMREEIFRMARTTPMATAEIAALVEGAARMGIQGKDNLLAFTRTAAMATTAFDLPADQLAEDMGKISNLYKIPIKNIEQLGDTINWLDDNAQSKGADIINVMQRMGGVADKLDYKKAAALGSTFLTLGANAEVAASASNAMVRELSIATMQSKRFQAGMETLGLRSESIEKAMATDAMGTIQMVLNKIKSLKAEDQLRVTTQLFGKEYGDDAAKLANNLGELERQLKLVNEAKSAGSMGREAGARNDTLDAQKIMAMNRVQEVSARLGETLKPVITDLANSFANVLDRINAWVQANPQLASGIMKAVAAGSVILVVLGALLTMLAGVMIPLATMRYGMALLDIQGFSLAGAFGKILGVLRMLAMAALSHPLLALIALIAAGALYIWANWSTLGPKIIGLWNNIRQYVSGVANNMVAYFQALPGKLMAIGAQMVNGLISGITSRLSALRDTVVGAASSAAAWFKQKLDIRSPSRVFHQYGVYTMAGLAQGIEATSMQPVRALSNMARDIMTVPIDRRPPIRMGGSGSAGLGRTSAAAAMGAIAAGSIVIHVHAAPGMNETDLAREVGREFDRRARAAATRRRSSYQDAD